MLVGLDSRGRGGNPARGTLKNRDVPEGLGVITAVVRRRLVGVRVCSAGQPSSTIAKAVRGVLAWREKVSSPGGSRRQEVCNAGMDALAGAVVGGA